MYKPDLVTAVSFQRERAWTKKKKIFPPHLASPAAYAPFVSCHHAARSQSFMAVPSVKPLSFGLFPCQDPFCFCFYTLVARRVRVCLVFLGTLPPSLGGSTALSSISISTRDVLHKFSVDLPKKHGRGGQSALRFARLRLEKRHNYVRKVCGHIQMYVTGVLHTAASEYIHV